MPDFKLPKTTYFHNNCLSAIFFIFVYLIPSFCVTGSTESHYSKHDFLNKIDKDALLTRFQRTTSHKNNYLPHNCNDHAPLANPDDLGSWKLETTNNSPVARHENAFVESGGKFYLMGGRGNKPVNIYAPETKTWSQGKNLPKNSNGQDIYLHHFQAVSLNGLIYAVGAFQGNYPNETPVPHVYIYNPANDSWQIGKEIPVNRRRGAAGVAVYNNKIYIVGGITNGHSSGFVKWLDIFDPATNSWTALKDANFARDHFHAAVVGNKLFAAGGRRSSASTGEVFSLTVPEVDVYDFTTSNWLSYPNGMANIPTERAGTSVAVLGEEIIVIGGESANNTNDLAHNQAEALNTLTGKWRSLAPLKTGRHGTGALVYKGGIYTAAGSGKKGGTPELTSLESFFFNEPVYFNWTERALSLEKRAEGQSIVYDNKIYVFAGFAPQLKLENSNEVYDPQTNKWTLLKPMPNDANGNPYAVTHNGIAVVDKTIWIVGGRVGDHPGVVTDKVWIYSVTNDSWSQGPTLPAPTAGGGMARVGRKLYVFGGFGPSACNGDKGDHLVYDLDKPQLGWKNLAPLPNPRNHFGTATVGGKIYAIGGQYGHDCGGGQDVNLVHAYNPATNTWSRVKDFPFNNSHMEPGTFTLDGKIIVTGGEINGSDIWEYDPDFDTWTKFDQMPVTLIAPSGKVIGNELIVSHGGIPTTQNPQNVTRVKTINRNKINKLDFLPAKIMLSREASGAAFTQEALLWTVTGSTNFSLNKTNMPTWLTVEQAGTFTDESAMQIRVNLNPAGLAVGTYTYTLQAHANGYITASLPISLTVTSSSIENKAPVVTNPGNQTSKEGSAISLQIKATDEQTLTYHATNLPTGLSINANGLISGTIAANASASSPFLTKIVVKDNGSPSLSSEVSFSWTVNKNMLPIVSAGEDKAVTLPHGSFTIKGTASDPDGNISSYLWTRESGPPATLANANSLNLEVSDLREGTYIFRLTVKDDNNAIAYAEMSLVVHPMQKIVSFSLINADTNTEIKTLTNGEELNLAKLPSRNLNIWANTDPPLVGSIIFDVKGSQSTINQAPYSLKEANDQWALSTGNHTITATPYIGINGTEGQGTTLSISFNVIDVNLLPVVSTGGDKTINLPYETLILVGMANDPDGSIIAYQWTKQSGPSATLSDENTPILSVANLQVGTYIFRLTATDDNNESAYEEMSLMVLPEQQVVSFSLINGDTEKEIKLLTEGEELIMTELPTMNLKIRANTDPQIVGSLLFEYNENQVILNTAPYILDLDYQVGTDLRTFSIIDHRITATPYSGADGSESKGTSLSISFSVIDHNLLPVVSAGGDQTIVLPVGEFIIYGTANDPDGSIIGYLWTQVSGPAASLINEGTANLSITGLEEGTYVFRLTATDNNLATAFDEMTLVVLSEQKVISFTLVNGDTDEELTTITEGKELNLATLLTNNVNIRANTSPSIVGSVVIDFNSTSFTANNPPYMISESVNRVSDSWSIATGSHFIEATPFSEPEGAGTKGKELSVEFYVINKPLETGEVITDVDIEEVNKNIVRLFPNPTLNKITLSALFDQETDAFIIMTSVKGEEVFSLTLNSQISMEKEFDLSLLNTGMYFLRVQHGEKNDVFKILKN